METTTVTGDRDYFDDVPSKLNRRDRERYAALTPWEQAVARRVAGRLYDGTRTVAASWKLALDTEGD